MASRLEVKMQAALAEGAFYEAAELCKAMATRAASKKDYGAAASLLSAGAAAQIAAGAAAGGVQRGIELAVQLVALFGTAKLPADNANVGRVLDVLKACPRECNPVDAAGVGSLGLSTDAAAIVSWLSSAIQWAHAADAGDGGAGAAVLHDALARYLWDCAGAPSLAAASAQFARGADVAAFAAVLAAAAAQPGAAAEADLFVLRGALQYCAAGQRHLAAQLPAAFVAAPHAPPLPAGGSPLTHFLELFLEALRCDAPTLAAALRSRYERALSRDPLLDAALDRAEAARWPEAYPAETPFGLGALLASLTA